MYVMMYKMVSYLTTVTLEVEVLVKSHHSDSLLAALGRNDGFIAAHTQGGETPEIDNLRACRTPKAIHEKKKKVVGSRPA